jgi:hypothetical protein
LLIHFPASDVAFHQQGREFGKELPGEGGFLPVLHARRPIRYQGAAVKSLRRQ